MHPFFWKTISEKRNNWKQNDVKTIDKYVKGKRRSYKNQARFNYQNAHFLMIGIGIHLINMVIYLQNI